MVAVDSTPPAELPIDDNDNETIGVAVDGNRTVIVRRLPGGELSVGVIVGGTPRGVVTVAPSGRPVFSVADETGTVRVSVSVSDGQAWYTEHNAKTGDPVGTVSFPLPSD